MSKNSYPPDCALYYLISFSRSCPYVLYVHLYYIYIPMVCPPLLYLHPYDMSLSI